MQIITILIFQILWTISLLGYGTIITYFDKSINFGIIPKEILFTLFGIIGIIIVTQIGVLFNFFVPLNQLFSFIILLGGFIFLALNGSFLLKSFSKTDKVILFLLFVYFSIFPHNSINNLDTLNYHITAIRWCNESPVPLGLANLHGRLGFNSSWFVSDAIIRPFEFCVNSRIFLLNSILSFFFSAMIFLTFKSILFIKKTISDYFILLCIFPLCFYLYNNSNPSPDNANLLLNLMLVILIIYSFIDSKIYNLFVLCIFIIGTFLVTIKLSSIVMLFCLGLLFIYLVYFKLRGIPSKFIDFNHINSRTLKVVFIFCGVIIIVPWLVKGVMLSGCLFYPSGFGYFSNLSWAVDPDQLLTEFKVTIAHSRFGNENCMNLPSTYYWLLPWIRFSVVNNLFLSFSFILILFVGYRYRKFLFVDPRVNFVLIASFLGIVYWFLTAPQPRYGYGSLFSFVLLFLAFFLKIRNPQLHLDKFNLNFQKVFLYIGSVLIILFVIVLITPIITILISMVEKLLHRPINHDLWSSFINGIRSVICITGLMLLLFSFIKLDKMMALLIVFILGMITYNITKSLSDIVNPCKLSKDMKFNNFIIKPYRTLQNYIVYSNPEPVLPSKINSNDSTFLVVNKDFEYNDCDIPLVYSPYFYPSIQIEFRRGKPYIFRTSKEFSRIEKFSFMFGIIPPDSKCK